MFQALFDVLFAPRFIADRCLIFRLNVFRELDQAFGCIIAPVQQHVLDALSQLGLNFFVHCELPRVDNSHVQTGANGVEKESGVHRLAHGVVPAKRKRNVTYSAANTCPR